MRRGERERRQGWNWRSNAMSAAALNGDVGSAAMLLKMRAQANKLGDVGPMIIRIEGALPPMRYEVDAEQGS